ncbi:MAG TPA: PqqD family protein [Planctomycetota bacterium]|nr:PqqD family protein [Planctomycetota bacterium]
MARYPTHAPGLASRLVGGEEVVVSPRAGRIWTFNAAGALVWELADGSHEVEEIATLLAGARGIDRGQAHDEIEAFGDELAARGLLGWGQVPGVTSRRAKRAAGSPPSGLAEPPRVMVEDKLQVLAGACISGHTTDGALCMTVTDGCVTQFM